jgi:hypothetical protein
MKTTSDKIAIMQASLNGRGIELRSYNSNDWHTIIGEISWGWSDFDYRIKPVEFPPLPEGKSYHNPAGLTPEQFGEGWRPLLPEEVDGRYGEDSDKATLAQCWCTADEEWKTSTYGTLKSQSYRIPSSTPFPEPPKPKMRIPLDFSEIPCGAIIHWTKTGTKVLVISINERSGSIYLGGSVISCPLQLLMDGDALISRDGGKTWQPCSKEG